MIESARGTDPRSPRAGRSAFAPARCRAAALRIVPALLLAAVCGAVECRAAGRSFEVRYSRQLRTQPFTGRVYLFFSKVRTSPRTGPGWFDPEIFVAKDVERWRPDVPLTFAPDEPEGMLAYPRPLRDVDLKGYRVQAVVRFNPFDRNVGTGTGNGYSAAASLDEPAPGTESTRFYVDQVVAETPFVETKWSKLLRVRSEKLSTFHKRDVFLQGAVILPDSYERQPARRYPVLFTVPGFGGTHHGGQVQSPPAEKNDRGVEFLRVVLDPSCPLGHHVFANSENNGPVGDAFVEEFLPALDDAYRTIAEPAARFLTGHSSGGWSTLWLQVAYPEVFNGTWSTAPDPVDFRDFQRIDLYRAEENMYFDREGRPRPLARVKDEVKLWYRGFSLMEEVLGWGGQLHSFEAAFSPRGDDGRPRLLWDRPSGRIDTETARTWEKYDLRLVLERNWTALEPRLRGKLHVFMGDADTFYLEGATVRLKDSLERLGSDAVVEIVPGKDHGTLLSADLKARIRREATARFLAAYPEFKAE